MINSYGHVLRVRDPATGEFKTIPAIRGERGPQGGPLTIAYAWDPDPSTEFTVEWQSTTEDKDQQTYIGVATYDGSDDGLAALTKSDYKWMQIPSGKDGKNGTDGLRGEKGEKGEKGNADRVYFAYAYEPYDTITFTPSGQVINTYNTVYDSKWSEGMTWLGVFSGVQPPTAKSDYTWVKMPKGESGTGSVKYRYAKKSADRIVVKDRLRAVAQYSPIKTYYIEGSDLFKTEDVIGKGKRYTSVDTLPMTLTLLTFKQVYRAFNSSEEMYFAYDSDMSYIRTLIRVDPEAGYYLDIDNSVDDISEYSYLIKGAITNTGCTEIYHCPSKKDTDFEYYRITIDKTGNKKYIGLQHKVGATLTRTNEYRNDLSFGKDEWFETEGGWDWYWTTIEPPYLVRVDDLPDNYKIICRRGIGTRSSHLEGSTLVYQQESQIVDHYYIDYGIGQGLNRYLLLSGDPSTEFAYLETSYAVAEAENPTWGSTLTGPITGILANGHIPVYKYAQELKDSIGNPISDSMYVVRDSDYSTFQNVTYYTEYNDEADHIGIYFGVKNDPSYDEYNWIPFRGKRGPTGGPVYIRYAKSNTKGGAALIDVTSITETWLGYEYEWIGIGVGDITYANEYGEGNNSDDSIYTWIPILRGITGEKGDTGPAGKDGKPSALLFRYSPFSDGINPDTGNAYMHDYRGPTDIYIGICKTAYYDPVTNQAVTDEDEPGNYLWLELPDATTIKEYGTRLGNIDERTWIETESLDLDSGTMVPSFEPVNMYVKDLSTKVDEFEKDHAVIQANLESYRLTSRKNDNANIDKLNVAVGYMRELLKRIRELESLHPLHPSSGSIELPYFDYSAVESENVPTNTSFSAHVKTNSNGRYDTYYISTLCTNDSTVWVKLKTGFDSILSSTDVYMFKVPLDPNEDIVRVQLSDTDYVASNGYYWYLLFKSKEENLLIQPMSPSVPENLYDYLIIERDKPTDA